MSKIVSIRLPETVYNQLQQTKESNKDIIIKALDQYFNPRNTSCFECKYKNLCDLIDQYLNNRSG